MDDVVVSDAKPAVSADRKSVIDAFGLEALLSVGVKSEIVVIESRVTGSSEGLFYDLYMKIVADLTAGGKALPEGFNYDAARAFYGMTDSS